MAQIHGVDIQMLLRDIHFQPIHVVVDAVSVQKRRAKNDQGITAGDRAGAFPRPCVVLEIVVVIANWPQPQYTFIADVVDYLCRPQRIRLFVDGDLGK